MFLWNPETGNVRLESVELKNLTRAGALNGTFVEVQNAVVMNFPNPDLFHPRSEIVGNAKPDEHGDFIYSPAGGGRRIDRALVAGCKARATYIEASHFGEVNVYYHINRCAEYVNAILCELNHRPLPKVVARVNAHGANIEHDGIRDGVFRKNKWFPFQGAHYRLPGKAITVKEHELLSELGEIHFGPGRRLTKGGALQDFNGGPYRANSSHNCGIIYHEYGHHLTRHTADFLANSLRPADAQSNRKTSLDEGYCDYLAATLMETPHIWALHHPHSDLTNHQRSLSSSRTMSDFDGGADEHRNGTIWASALWQLRSVVGKQVCDRLVFKSLILIGKTEPFLTKCGAVTRAREPFAVALAALLNADQELYSGLNRKVIRSVFEQREICAGLEAGMS
ncbi:hypothetical protein BH11ARM1_BH11ARM1_04010 [soil metagenome]